MFLQSNMLPQLKGAEHQHLQIFWDVHGMTTKFFLQENQLG